MPLQDILKRELNPVAELIRRFQARPEDHLGQEGLQLAPSGLLETVREHA